MRKCCVCCVHASPQPSRGGHVLHICVGQKMVGSILMHACENHQVSPRAAEGWCGLLRIMKQLPSIFEQLLLLHSSTTYSYFCSEWHELCCDVTEKKNPIPFPLVFFSPHSFSSIPCSSWHARFQLADVLLINVFIITTETE